MDINEDRSFRRYPRNISEVPDQIDELKAQAKLKVDETIQNKSAIFRKLFIAVLILVAIGIIASASCLLLGRGFFCMNSTEWSDWSPCSNQCGKGDQTRRRSMSAGKSDEIQTRQCVESSGCDAYSGAWSDWTAWSRCSQTCDKGSQTRTRECRASGRTVNPERCTSGDAAEVKDCYNKELCLPLAWTSWSEWSTCHKHCVKQERQRSRQCSDGKSWKPANSSACPTGIDKEVENCTCNDPRYLTLFERIFGWDCIRGKYVKQRYEVSTAEMCASICYNATDCQAFTMDPNPKHHCKMFFFNRCSKEVKICGCKTNAKIFVKNRPGLKPGTLCPADYGKYNCGVLYKMMKTGLYGVDANREKCNAEPGLVILAEPIGTSAIRHIFNFMSKEPPSKQYSRGIHVYAIGGQQDPGSKEPAGGWFWSTCRIQISAGDFLSGEPNDHGGLHTENSVHLFRERLVDLEDKRVVDALCECVSPFDIF